MPDLGKSGPTGAGVQEHFFVWARIVAGLIFVLGVVMLIWPPSKFSSGEAIGAFAVCMVFVFAFLLAPVVSNIKVLNLLELRTRELVQQQARMAERVDRLVTVVDLDLRVRARASATAVVDIRSIQQPDQTQPIATDAEIPIEAFVSAVAIALNDTPLGERARLIETLPPAGTPYSDWVTMAIKRGFTRDDLQMLELFRLVIVSEKPGMGTWIRATPLGQQYSEMVRFDRFITDSASCMESALPIILKAAGSGSAD